MPHRAVVADQVLEEDDVYRLPGGEEHGRGVQVDFTASGELFKFFLTGRRLPAQAHPDGGQDTAVGLAQADLLSLEVYGMRVPLAESGSASAVGRPGSSPVVWAAYGARGTSGWSDVDAEVLGDSRESGGVPLADRPELPLLPVPVELTEDHRGLGGRVLGQVVAGEFGSASLVDDADEGVADLAEALAALFRVVDRDRKDDLVDLRGTRARSTLMASSSPSPSPVRLSPVCSTEPSGLVRLL